MKKLKRTIFHVLLGLSIIGIPIFAFGILNTSVSLKYETNNLTDCISLVSGDDLCHEIKVFKGLLIACILAIFLLTIFRKRILP